MSLDVYLYMKECQACGAHPMLFNANITHNLGPMAKEAEIYDILWRPDENGIEIAMQLIDQLEDAIKIMQKDPERFKKYDSENGWGLYEHFVPWLSDYLEACKDNPEAEVSVSR